MVMKVRQKVLGPGTRGGEVRAPGQKKGLRKVTKYQALVKAVQLTLIPLVSLCGPLNSDDGRHRPAVAPIINFRMSCEVL